MKSRIFKTIFFFIVLLQVPLFARGQSYSEPIKKIAVISLLDDSMCVYVTQKGFITNKTLLMKIRFQHGSHLNKVIQGQFSSLLDQNFEVVQIQNWESRLHRCRFPGMKKFWSIQENCNIVYQMVQESKVDAILLVHPYSKKDITRENNLYAPAGGCGGGFLGGFIAGALQATINEATGENYMTAPELMGDYVFLHLNVGLYDVRGWKSGYPQIHPKKICNNYLDFRGRYRQDRISSNVSPTQHDQMMICEVVRLCLPNQAAKTLSQMKLYPQTQKKNVRLSGPDMTPTH